MRRSIVTLLALAMTLALAAAPPSSAQEWPSRPISLVVPFAAGSTPDLIARTVAEPLGGRLGQPVVIENKAGASGNAGTGAVAQAQPDGYTLGVSIVGPLALNALLFPKMPYDPKTDLALVTVVSAQPSVLVVNNDLPVRSTEDVLALLKRDGAKLNFGSIGNGSLSHLAVEAIAAKSGGRPVHVPFTSSPAVVTALIRGDVQLAVLPAASVVPQGEAGHIRMMAVTSAQRSALLPNLPTLAEAGVAGVEADAWVGLIAPAATPPAVLSRLEREVRAVLQEPATREKLKAQYSEPIGSSPREFRDLIDAELRRWGPIIERNGIRIGQ